MTREDVALVLYRFALTLGAEALTDTGALMAYPDGGELSGEGAAAVPAPRDAPMAGGRLLGGDVPADDPASAALAGRRGRHAGLPLAAAAEGARP